MARYTIKGTMREALMGVPANGAIRIRLPLTGSILTYVPGEPTNQLNRNKLHSIEPSHPFFTAIRSDASKCWRIPIVDRIGIGDDQVAPIEEIANGLTGLKVAFVNVFGVKHRDGSWTLIDAAIPFSASRIRHWAKEAFGRPPEAIILTHGHFDHTSAARELGDEWEVPIYAHVLEFPYLTGKQEYPAPNWAAGGGVMPLMSPTLPRGPIELGDRLIALPEEGSELSMASMPGWTLLHTPGHTPGHVSFYREADRTLIVGDAFCTTPAESFFAANFTQPAELHGPPSYFTSDWQAAQSSVRQLSRLLPAAVAPGHGKPLSGTKVASALQALAEDFARIAVPDNVTTG